MKPSKLREEVALELASLRKTVDDVHGLLALTADRDSSIYDRAAAGLFLAQFYNGVENILKRICKFNGIPFPEGSNWHTELFQRFCDPPLASLPLLFPSVIEENFVILRRFRHFVQHSYSFYLDWERLRMGMETLEPAFSFFEQQVQNYLNTLLA